MNFSWKYHRCITKVHRNRVYLSHITSINGKIKPKFTNSLFPKVVRTSKRYKVVNWMAFLCKSFCKHTLDIRVRLDKTFQDQNMRIYSQCLIQDPLFVSQNCIHDLILSFTEGKYWQEWQMLLLSIWQRLSIWHREWSLPHHTAKSDLQPNFGCGPTVIWKWKTV